MFQKLKDLLYKWSKEGIYLPFIHDPVNNQPSVSLFFAYVTFILAVISTIVLHVTVGGIVATGASIGFWGLATIFYLIRNLQRAKIDLDDQEIELDGENSNNNEKDEKEDEKT